MKNPIFIEYYSHEQADCYKINLPYTKYANERIVLCKVSEGEEKAARIAQKILIENIIKALEQPLDSECKNL